METIKAERAVLDVAWGAWTELGLAGDRKWPRRLVIDPEPLLSVTPALFSRDRRLRDHVLSWCRQHGSWLSRSRLARLVGRLPEAAQVPFADFAATLSAAGGQRWPLAERGRPWPSRQRAESSAQSLRPFPRSTGGPGLPLHRPALLRFRLRALVGVGARADVLAELLSLSRPESWLRASELVPLGLTRRNAASVLAELAGAGIVYALDAGNARLYRLSHPETLGELVAAEGLAWPDWSALASLLLVGLELTGLRELSPRLLRVELHALRERLLPLALHLGMPLPPESRALAWEDLEECFLEALGSFPSTARRAGRG